MRAVGYQTDAVKIFQYEGSELVVPYRENVQPDTTAAIFWLKNRKPEQWREKTENDTTLKAGGDLAALLARVATGNVFPKDDNG